MIYIRRVADQADGLWRLVFDILFDKRHRFFEIVHNHIHIANGATAFSAFGVHFHDQTHAFIHRNGQRLSAAHAAQASRQNKLPFERTPTFEFG